LVATFAAILPILRAYWHDYAQSIEGAFFSHYQYITMHIWNAIFGPIQNFEYCYYFYILEIISLGFAIILLFTYLFASHKMPYFVRANLPQTIISAFLAYFVNRLLYSMCMGTLK